MEKERTGVALFILRVGLGLFLLLWSLDKLADPGYSVKLFSKFYFLGITASVAYVVGILEALLSLALLAGFKKTFTYGLATLLHAISTLSTYSQLLSPFGQNHLFIAGLPVLAAFIALFLLRQQDILWTLDPVAKKSEFLNKRLRREPDLSV